MYLELAQLQIEVKDPSPAFCAFAKDYCLATPLKKTSDIVVFVTPQERETEWEKIQKCYSIKTTVQKESAQFAVEQMCILRAIAKELYRYDAFLLHACAVCVDGQGFAFYAKSGTGKSTHAAFWQELLKDRFSYINGDKPILRFLQGKPYLCASPFAGKEGYQTKQNVPLRALISLHRDKRNRIEKKTAQEAFFSCMHAILHPKEETEAQQSIALLKKTVELCENWDLFCNLEPQGAKISIAPFFSL